MSEYLNQKDVTTEWNFLGHHVLHGQKTVVKANKPTHTNDISHTAVPPNGSFLLSKDFPHPIIIFTSI